MKVHEYQARDLLERHGIPVPPAVLASTAELAAQAYDQLARAGAHLAVVKAQVHAGGRGKGGGVKLVRSAAEARQAAQTIMSGPLITPQTGPAGVPVGSVLVAAGVDIAHEYYLAVATDRAGAVPALIASAQGGMDIEQVAATNPQAIIRQPLDPTSGLAAYQGRKVAARLGMAADVAKQAGPIMQQLARLFLNLDATLVEINPLVVTKPNAQHPSGAVLAIDAKINLDDNALFRHPDLAALADPAEEDPSERRAKNAGLSFIKLDGNIGCLVNGAGLAMATMDLIKLHGGEPANFLDVGGSADQEAVTEAFRIILSDPKVRGVLVNIFGGIMRCDIIASAIIAAAKGVGFEVPLVVRLEGTNVDLAKTLLNDACCDLPTLQTADDLTAAAAAITRLIGVSKPHRTAAPR